MKRASAILLLTAIASYGNGQDGAYSLEIDPINLELTPKEESHIICVSPAFPKDENGNLLEGEVFLLISIGNDSKPTDISISKSSGDSRIDEVAVKNAKASIFLGITNKTIEQKFSFQIEK